MSYKNDSMLVIANKFGMASANAKSDLFETYDKLRDLTVSGSASGGSGFGTAASWLINASRLIAPGSYMPLFDNQSMNIPGTSYSSPVSGGTAITSGGRSAFGIGGLGNFSGFPSGGAAPVFSGIGNMFSSLSSDFTVGGVYTGGAASMVNFMPSATSAAAGTYAGLGGVGSNLLLPTAGFVAGVGGILASMGPYLGPMGLGATVIGNLAQGYGGAALGAYQSVTSQILSNADVTLSNKVKNIETVVKMLDTQSDVVKKMLKEGIEADSKALQNL